MNTEEQIAAELARRVEEPVTPDVPTAPLIPAEPQNFLDKLLPEEQMTAMKIMDYLSVPTIARHDMMVDDYVKTVYEWARDNAGSSDMSQLIRVISEQEQHMGSKLKPDRLRRLAEYVKISRLRVNLAARERELYG